MYSKLYNIFISHAWKYGDDYDRLINLLNSDSSFYYRNYSAPKDKPLMLDYDSYVYESEIKRAIDNKIKYVSCVLIIGGMYAKRKWMKYELLSAQKFGKPIIVVEPWGQERIPCELDCYPHVGWSTKSIVGAIAHYSK